MLYYTPTDLHGMAPCAVTPRAEMTRAQSPANTILLSTFSRDIYFILLRDAVAILRASNFPSITPSGKRKNFVQPGSLFCSINDALKQIILIAH